MMRKSFPGVLIRGGGDLASGVAYRLFKGGFSLLIVERENPRTVRRRVAFASAVYRGKMEVEDVEARLVSDYRQFFKASMNEEIPVTTLPDAPDIISRYNPRVIIDARMIKNRPEDTSREEADVVIGLGPGFSAGDNVDAAVETNRGHYLGRALYEGSPDPYTGRPGEIAGESNKRVIHAPVSGRFQAEVSIGDMVVPGDTIGYVEKEELIAEIEGIIRGLLKSGLQVEEKTKLADIDPRKERSYVDHISDKALAVGGGALESVLHLLPE